MSDNLFPAKSDQINDLAAALCKFQEKCPALELDRQVKVRMKSGGEYAFSYSTIGNIKKVITPLLAENGLSYTQPILSDGTVITVLMHISGQFISSSLLIKGDNTPQGIGSAITYAKRYSLAAILGLVADEDDDANMAEGNEYTVSSDKVENNKPWLNENTKEYAGALVKLKAGTTTIEKIKTVMKISKATEAKLKEAMKPESVN
jgi:hypothetical protein